MCQLDPQMESAPPPNRSPGSSEAGLPIWWRSSSAWDPQRLLLGYPAPLIPPMPPHKPCLPASRPPAPPTPVPLLHCAKMPSPGPWVMDWSEVLPVLSRLCHPELECPAPPFPAPPAVEPPSTPPPTLLPPVPPPLPLAPTAGAAGPELAAPTVVPPLPVAPAWECAM